jgi:hypothetical protein
VITAAALAALGGALLMPFLPTYSADWPERINLEYWLDADTGDSHYLARCDSLRLPAALAAAADFDPVPRPRFAEGASLAFYAAAPQQPLRDALAVPELRLTAPPTPTSLPGLSAPPAPTAPAARSAPTSRFATHYELSLRSARGAPEAFMVFPASAQVSEVVLTTTAGPVRAKLGKLQNGATILNIVALPAAGVEFSIDAAGRLPLKVQVFDQSYAFPEQRLQRARPSNATSSQDGDLTVVHRTRSLDPAADHADPKPI